MPEKNSPFKIPLFSAFTDYKLKAVTKSVYDFSQSA
jgi:hypothetical protein